MAWRSIGHARDGEGISDRHEGRNHLHRPEKTMDDFCEALSCESEARTQKFVELERRSCARRAPCRQAAHLRHIFVFRIACSYRIERVCPTSVDYAKPVVGRVREDSLRAFRWTLIIPPKVLEGYGLACELHNVDRRDALSTREGLTKPAMWRYGINCAGQGRARDILRHRECACMLVSQQAYFGLPHDHHLLHDVRCDCTQASEEDVVGSMHGLQVVGSCLTTGKAIQAESGPVREPQVNGGSG
eukprot:scaffold185326_cov33-Tisochrysis_lutea.AAC.2